MAMPSIAAIMPQSRAPWTRQAIGITCSGAARASTAADGSNAFNRQSNKTAATRRIG
jgi:hypothetical protein